MIKWSQSALLLTEVGQEYVRSWFNPVTMAKVLTGIHERSGFPVWKSWFEPVANGYLVNHSPTCIFLITPLRPLTLKMQILMHYMPYFWHFGSPYYALLCWWQPSWKMAPCVNHTHFWRCHHTVSWSPHTTDWFLSSRQTLVFSCRYPPLFGPSAAALYCIS